MSAEYQLVEANAMQIRDSIHHLHVRHARRINRTGLKVFRIEDYLKDLEPPGEKVRLSLD